MSGMQIQCSALLTGCRWLTAYSSNQYAVPRTGVYSSAAVERGEADRGKRVSLGRRVDLARGDACRQGEVLGAESVQREHIVMRLVVRRRTRAAIGGEAEVRAPLRRPRRQLTSGVSRARRQRRDRARNVVNRPVPPARS